MTKLQRIESTATEGIDEQWPIKACRSKRQNFVISGFPVRQRCRDCLKRRINSKSAAAAAEALGRTQVGEVSIAETNIKSAFKAGGE